MTTQPTSHPHRASRRRRSRLAVAAAVTAGLATVLAACSGSAEETPQQTADPDEIEEALQTETNLTFWTWVPGIEEEVAKFTEKYPAITVDVVNAGQGLPHYTKIRTAMRAGDGAPDLAQVTYDYISTFTINDSLVDLRPYVSEDIESKFVDWTMEQVAGPDGEIWAIPQDTGPMGMLYRQDIFDEHGLEVPKTWDEFAETARTLHEADPNVYLANYAANSNDFWSALNWQAGVKPYEVHSPTELTLDVNNDRSKEIAAYWQELFQDDLISTDPAYTDEWYQALNDGRYAAWVVPAWGPLFLESNAESTSGLWRAAPMPVWDESEQVSGNWGGSTTAVLKGTEHEIAAAALAEFLNSDPEVSMDLATKRSLFPAALSTLENPEFLEIESEFYGGQKVNQLFSEISQTVTQGFEFPPFRDQDVTVWIETVGAAMANGEELAPALDEWDRQITEYATEQGFTVN